MKTAIKFINHASVIVTDGVISILSDPWFFGDIFNKGWSLLHEASIEEVNIILDEITHIWISHEHPDHFSIPFFKSFAKKLKDNNIKIFIQKTKDRRVFNFLNNLDLSIHELDFNKKLYISKDFNLTCIKDGFYDSGLLIESHSEKILNLNDCEVRSHKRINEVFAITGNVDVLLTQFSYAAWKGGLKNKKWRVDAAREKIETMKLQIEKFRPKYVIPFASFVYFSNFDNFYLNDSVNVPLDMIADFKNSSSRLVFMAPGDVLRGRVEFPDQDRAVEFWSCKYKNIKPINNFQKIDLTLIRQSFEKYCTRISQNNNLQLMRIIRVISPIKLFGPVVIGLDDLNVKLKFDYIDKIFVLTDEPEFLSMKSESLDFIFRNSFGFDTLTVNGCFEEKSQDGFLNSTKTLAIENLNNMGIKFNFGIFFNMSIIRIFISRLRGVVKRLA